MDVQETEVQTDRVLTIPNVLSFIRLLGVPVFLWLILVPEADTAAFVLLALSGGTDWLDGKIARAAFVLKHRGRACSDEVVPFTDCEGSTFKLPPTGDQPEPLK